MIFCKRFIPILLVVGALIATARFCHYQTKGFRISKIQNNLLDNTHVELSSEEIQLMRCLFAYKFRYLARGLQSFVFLSEDGEHVLKIFNNAHQRKSAFFHALSRFPFWGSWAAKKAAFFEKKWQRAHMSYQIAFNEMREKTGLLFVHSHKTDTLPPLHIVDPLRISHLINPNELGFLIQKKVTLVYPSLQEWIASGDLDRAKRSLGRLLDLLIWKCQRGILDNDPLIRTNFGFLDEEALQIDVGPFSKDEGIKDPQKMREEIFRITSSLKNWLSEKSPELLIFLDQQLQERLCF